VVPNGLAGELLPTPRFVKTFLTRTLPLLLSIVVGTALSWVSIYLYWFGMWTFHSIPAARACGALGTFLLLPARWIFEMMGGDQTTVFYDPTSFSGANGLVLGILFYAVFGHFWKRREKSANVKAAEPQRQAAKAG